jgi:hypothetical protein
MPITTTPKLNQPPPDRGAQLRAPVQGEDTPGHAESSEHELPPEILNKRICDFDLHIEGGPLENVIERFRRELAEHGITKLQPTFYLSDEWGVSDGSVAIAIPFYLADERLRRVQQVRSGVTEGKDDEDILRYLRHEMGHVVNYAYHLYEDHDWAETFAVWMTPGSDWTTQHQDASAALAKLLYCERIMTDVRHREPYVTLTDIDTDRDRIFGDAFCTQAANMKISAR